MLSAPVLLEHPVLGAFAKRVEWRTRHSNEKGIVTVSMGLAQVEPGLRMSIRSDLKFGGFRQRQRVLNFYTKVANRGLDL